MQSSANGKKRPYLSLKTLLIMKLTAFFLLVAFLQVSAKAYSQNINLSVKNEPLAKVFQELKKQSGYQFFYNDAMLKAAQPVTLDVKGMPFENVLETVFKNQPLTYSIVSKTVVIKDKPITEKKDEPIFMPLPPVDVYGVVKDEKGKPIVGASVQVKGTNKITTTNDSGEFNLQGVQENGMIVFSSVNTITYELKIAAGKSNNVVITLKAKIRELDEVAITSYNTGFQQIPKERATGSYAFVTNKELNQQTGTNILARLEGISNGVLFDHNMNRPAITIRGLSTIYGNKNPLVIVDNFPYEGDINNINPDDVENITVLKDASAASIWGTRAGNGVIVISLKKGNFSKPLSVSFNSIVSLSPRPELDYLKPMSSSEFIDVEELLFAKGFYNTTLASTSRTGVSPVIELLVKKSAGQLTSIDANSRINAMRSQSLVNDYEKYMYQEKLTGRYSLSFDGGSQSATYRVSAGMDRNTSELAATFNKLNLYVDNIFRPIQNLQVNTSLYYTQSHSRSSKPPYGSFSIGGQQLPPYTRLQDENGNALALNYYREPYTDTVGAGKLLDWKSYPLEDWKHNFTMTNKQDLIASTVIQYRLAKGLSLYAKYQYERQWTTASTTQDINSFSDRDLINRFTQINRTTGVVKYIVPYGDILSNSISLLETQNARGQITYSNSFGPHEISLISGAEIRQSKNNSSSTRLYGYNSDVSTIANVDLVNTYPNFITGSNQAIPNGNSIGGTLNRYTSLFFSGAYSFRKTYTLSASARKDESNLFGVNANEKGVPLYSVGAGWEISRGNFYHLGWLPFLKFRLSYGSSGNVDNSKSAVTTTMYAPITAQFSNLPYANVSQFANPDLRWEKIYILNMGIDFFLASVFSGSIEYYHKTGVDLFGSAPIDYTTGLGVNSLTKNVANIAGNGWDIQLNAKLLRTKLQWNQSFILNYTKSIVTKYFQVSSLGNSYISSGESISPLEGRPVYSVIAYKWAGLDPATGDPMGYLNGLNSKDYNSITGTGTSINDLVFKGSSVPTFFGNFLNSFVYKNWSLSFNITYKLAYYFRRSSINYNLLYTNSAGHDDFAKRWIKPGDEAFTNIPSMIYPTTSARDNFYTNSEILVDKGDHIRLQFVNIAYTIKKWQLYLNAANLGILWRGNKDHIDPDYPSSLPPTPVYSFGVKGNF